MIEYDEIKKTEKKTGEYRFVLGLVIFFLAAILTMVYIGIPTTRDPVEAVDYSGL